MHPYPAFDLTDVYTEVQVLEGATLEGACVASGSGYWDALSGAALAGSRNSVLLLADEGALGALGALSPAPSRAYVLGGEASVPASVWDYLTGGK